LREAARLFPQSPKPAFELANAWLFSGEPGKAEAELQPILQAGGPHQAMRAKLDVYRGRFANAAAAYQAMNQPFWKGWVLAMGSHDLASAARIAADLEAQGKSAEWPFLLYVVMHDVDRAAALARAGRPGNLRDIMPYFQAERAYKQGNLAEAITGYEKLAQKLSSGDGARYRLIELYLEAGDA